MVWLGEEKVSCHCPQCEAVNPFVLQTQVALRAWQAAKRVKPTLRLRILLTQGSYDSNAKVLAVVTDRKKGTVPICAKHPEGRSGKWGLSPFSDVAVTYYDGNRTYDSSRRTDDLSAAGEVCGRGRRVGLRPPVDRLIPGRLPVDWAAIYQSTDVGVRRQAPALLPRLRHAVRSLLRVQRRRRGRMVVERPRAESARVRGGLGDPPGLGRSREVRRMDRRPRPGRLGRLRRPRPLFLAHPRRLAHVPAGQAAALRLGPLHLLSQPASTSTPTWPPAIGP